MYEVPEWTAPHQITMNWITQSQNKGLHHKIMRGLCSSEILCTVQWWVHTDISGQPISPSYKESRNPKERTEHQGN